MRGKNMKQEIQIETAKGITAVAGAFASALTLNEAVMVATLLYIVMQTLYLGWKWYREAKRG